VKKEKENTNTFFLTQSHYNIPCSHYPLLPDPPPLGTTAPTSCESFLGRPTNAGVDGRSAAICRRAAEAPNGGRGGGELDASGGGAGLPPSPATRTDDRWAALSSFFVLVSSSAPSDLKCQFGCCIFHSLESIANREPNQLKTTQEKTFLDAIRDYMMNKPRFFYFELRSICWEGAKNNLFSVGLQQLTAKIGGISGEGHT
jgi:hypothetical protein